LTSFFKLQQNIAGSIVYVDKLAENE